MNRISDNPFWASPCRRRPIIPIPDTLEELERLCHRDLPALRARDLWAEEKIIEWELARRIFSSRDRLIVVGSRVIHETTWLIERHSELRRARDARR